MTPGEKKIAEDITTEMTRAAQVLKAAGATGIIIAASYKGLEGGALEGHERELLNLLHYLYTRVSTEDDDQEEAHDGQDNPTVS